VGPGDRLVHVFLPSGLTFTFHGFVEADNESSLVIRYKAQSDDHAKVATIQKRAIVGWSVTAEED
jgi:hypothetical protein